MQSYYPGYTVRPSSDASGAYDFILNVPTKKGNFFNIKNLFTSPTAADVTQRQVFGYDLPTWFFPKKTYPTTQQTLVDINVRPTLMGGWGNYTISTNKTIPDASSYASVPLKREFSFPRTALTTSTAAGMLFGGYKFGKSYFDDEYTREHPYGDNTYETTDLNGNKRYYYLYNDQKYGKYAVDLGRYTNPKDTIGWRIVNGKFVTEEVPVKFTVGPDGRVVLKQQVNDQYNVQQFNIGNTSNDSIRDVNLKKNQEDVDLSNTETENNKSSSTRVTNSQNSGSSENSNNKVDDALVYQIPLYFKNSRYYV